MSQAEAEAEVSRLNQLNTGKGYVYLYCTSRLIESHNSSSPESPAPVANECNGDFSSTTDSGRAFSDYERERPTSRPAFGLWLSPLLRPLPASSGSKPFSMCRNH